MGDPEATVKLSEILRNHYTEQFEKITSYLSVNPYIDSYCGSDYFAPLLTASLIR